MQTDPTQPTTSQPSPSAPLEQMLIVRRYGGWMLLGLVTAYVIGLYLTAIGTLSTNVVVSNIGLRLLTIDVVTLAVLDWGGFSTINGLLDWSTVKGQRRFWLTVAFIGLLLIDLGIYLARAVKRFYAVTQIQPHAQMQTLIPKFVASPRPMQAIIASSTAAAVLLLSIGSVAALGSGGHTSYKQTNAVVLSTVATQPTQAPTELPTAVSTQTVATPIPTRIPTPGPLPTVGVNAAIVGGTLTAFEAKFGQPNSKSAPAGGQYNFGDNNFLMINIDYNDPTGQRVMSIIATSPTKADMDPVTARYYCMSFAPRDGRFQQRVTVTDAQGIEDFDDIYVSATLTRYFTADQFKDASLNPVQAGSFDIQYLLKAPNDLSHIDSCTIQIGAEQTIV